MSSKQESLKSCVSRRLLFRKGSPTYISTSIVIVIILFCYCYTNTKDEGQPNPTKLTLHVKPVQNKTGVDGRGFWKGLSVVKQHIFDKSLCNGLISFLNAEKVKTLLELGAGTGEYAKHIKESGIFVSCYDGNPQTQDLSEGRCGVLDFSKPLDLNPHEWVLSFEVGEHIPAAYEDVFMKNLNNLNQKGILLSWTIIGQTGSYHVNNHNNSYIRDKFHSFGYDSDFESEILLRKSASYGWFKNTIMVFRKTI